MKQSWGFLGKGFSIDLSIRVNGRERLRGRGLPTQVGVWASQEEIELRCFNGLMGLWYLLRLCLKGFI